MNIHRFLLTLLVLTSVNVFACECSYIKSVEKEFENADYVLTGKVIKIEYINVPETINEKIKKSNSQEEILNIFKGISLAKITLKIKETLKGINKNERIIYTMIGGGSCGFSFKKSKEYLIYAFKEESLNNELKKHSESFKNALHTNYCSRTKKYSESEIKKIKEFTR